MIEKYIAPDSVEEWIKKNNKCHRGGSVIWKAVVKTFDVIEDSLAWNIGNGRRMRVGVDPWASCNRLFILSVILVESLRQHDVIYLFQLDSPIPENRWSQYW